MSDRPQPAYEESVFINCPFDPDFRDLLLAIVFSVAAHGLVPRSARETEGAAEPRISRIWQTLAGSKYSIHDLSRFSGEGPDNICPFQHAARTWNGCGAPLRAHGNRPPSRSVQRERLVRFEHNGDGLGKQEFALWKHSAF
jgi:hypothetical protein